MTSLELTAGDYTAVVDTLGATLCSVSHRSRPLILPQTPGTPTVDYRGVVCVPWPNRLANGSYVFEGNRYEVPVTEPARSTALHGLGYAREWEVLTQSDAEAVLALQFGSDPGYPYNVRVEAHYKLAESGLSARILAVNKGYTPAPYGSCPHPYLVAGPGLVDDWTLQLDAGRYMEVASDRLLPVGLANVDSGPFDFRSGRTIGSTVIDNAFTSVTAADGRWEARLTASDGHGVAISWDPLAKWVQICTADAVDAAPRAGLAVEPMDCAPDAFNSRADLLVLPPNGMHPLKWSLRAI